MLFESTRRDQLPAMPYLSQRPQQIPSQLIRKSLNPRAIPANPFLCGLLSMPFLLLRAFMLTSLPQRICRLGVGLASLIESTATRGSPTSKHFRGLAPPRRLGYWPRQRTNAGLLRQYAIGQLSLLLPLRSKPGLLDTVTSECYALPT